MELTGEYSLPAGREAVWRALNDRELLRRCIPGCEELEQISATEFAAKVKSKIGPVSARFSGRVHLEDLSPPESYTIRGEGEGGVAGFAKGSARVSLEARAEATVLRYVADAQVGGKLAQLGSRVLKGTAQKLADQFFGSLAAQLGGAPVPAPTPVPSEEG
jgi:carbon monoxide dehydrogenase subunit G